MIKVGIPRALLYFEYAPLWLPFFNELGAEVVLSQESNKKILNDGTSHVVDDACIPVKLYQGHMLDIKDKVDYIFVPRIMGIYPKEYICPKICGLPELVKYSISDLPTMIHTIIDLRKKNQLKKAMMEVGSYITNDKGKIQQAYQLAIENYKKEKENKKEIEQIDKAILLLGHPYVLDDDYLNMNIKKKIEKKGYHIVTPDVLEEEILNQYAQTYHKKIFWLFFRKMIGSVLHLMNTNKIDGVIYITSFGCGIDSVVASAVERKIRQESKLPFMLLTIDEHRGEAGFDTRLEAFTDMLKWRNSNENNLSPHGNNLYTNQNDAR